MHKLQRLVLLAALLLFAPVALGGNTTTWRVALESGALGPVEFYLETTLDGDRITGRNLSGSLELLQAVPGERSIDTGLLVFSGDLDPARIESVEIYMSGRMHALYEEQ